MSTTVPAQGPVLSMDVGEGLPTALYRLYSADDVLLYVGVTESLKARFAQHAADKVWWPQVTRKTAEWYASRAEALHAEIAAIRAENPVHNRRGRAPKLRTPRRARSTPLPLTVPAWSAGDAESIRDQLSETLERTDLSHAHFRLLVTYVLLTGKAALPHGAELEKLASYCGISHTAAYQLRKETLATAPMAVGVW